MNYLGILTEKYPLIKNKYFLVLLVFLIWVTFIDKNNLISQYQDRQVLYGLDKEKRYYQSEIQTTQDKLNELKTDNKSIEKFAREKYLMKKENEEIWLVVDKSVKSE